MQQACRPTKRPQLVLSNSLVQRLSLLPQAFNFLCWLTDVLGCLVASQRIDGLLNQRLAGLDNSSQSLLHCPTFHSHVDRVSYSFAAP